MMLHVKETSFEFVKSIIQPRLKSSRKGDNGKVLVVGGSWMFHGAPFLAAMSALRSGVDLVYLATPKTIATSVRSLSPDLIVLPLPDMKLKTGCARRLIKWLPNVDSAVIGPGLGKGCEDGVKLLVRELKLKEVPLVLDADALHYDIVRSLNDRRHVITPHAGEFNRLFNVLPSGSLEERCKVVESKAKENNFTILLKGPIDVVSDGETTYVNRTGSAAMTVGGTGDVLSGILGALVAKKIPTCQAAAASAYLNGKAGEVAFERKGLHIVASDLIEILPEVQRPFDSVVE
ncbi:MAG: NAD(P)H-hydrate dehydratase [Nitrososphaeria archaeon]